VYAKRCAAKPDEKLSRNFSSLLRSRYAPQAQRPLTAEAELPGALVTSDVTSDGEFKVAVVSAANTWAEALAEHELVAQYRNARTVPMFKADGTRVRLCVPPDPGGVDLSVGVPRSRYHPRHRAGSPALIGAGAVVHPPGSRSVDWQKLLHSDPVGES